MIITNNYAKCVTRFDKVPGDHNEIQLLAWKHRHQSPWILATILKVDVDGRGIRLRMMPRSFWEADPRFLDEFRDDLRDVLRYQLDEASFETHTHSFSTQMITHHGKTHMAGDSYPAHVRSIHDREEDQLTGRHG
jgi:hypothetical protein